jgi:hypothetical protein
MSMCSTCHKLKAYHHAIIDTQVFPLFEFISFDTTMANRTSRQLTSCSSPSIYVCLLLSLSLARSLAFVSGYYNTTEAKQQQHEKKEKEINSIDMLIIFHRQMTLEIIQSVHWSIVSNFIYELCDSSWRWPVLIVVVRRTATILSMIESNSNSFIFIQWQHFSRLWLVDRRQNRSCLMSIVNSEKHTYRNGSLKQHLLMFTSCSSRHVLNRSKRSHFRFK